MDEGKQRVIGIVLVRNEERFVRQAVLNGLALCDRMLLLDHGSSDGTREVLEELATQEAEKMMFRSIRHPRESHELLKPYVGTATWIFGVDGDEVYDPLGLQAFRARLLAGEFDSHWMILGNVLHCDRVDADENLASGYLAPPSRSITKLYNFAAIDSWDGDTPERLHGGRPVFRGGFSGQDKRRLELEHAWDESPLRCLHACFVSRSSLDSGVESRENIMETYCGGWTNFLKRWGRRMLGHQETSDWKRQRYARGGRVEVSTRPFFPEP